jgi:hypothetical protein
MGGPSSRLSRAARSAADQLGKPGEDKAPDEPRQTHKYEQIGRRRSAGRTSDRSDTQDLIRDVASLLHGFFYSIKKEGTPASSRLNTCSGADGSCARLRFRAAIKSITGDGVDTARGLMVSPFVFASISCCNAS